MPQKSATDKQKERESNYKKLESNDISEQIITKHYCRAKNCTNLGKPCYTEGSIHIPLTSDHVKRWVDYVIMEKATVYEPPSELRKPWIEGYQKKQQLKKGKKKQVEADKPPQLYLHKQGIFKILWGLLICPWVLEILCTLRT